MTKGWDWLRKTQYPHIVLFCPPLVIFLRHHRIYFSPRFTKSKPFPIKTANFLLGWLKGAVWKNHVICSWLWKQSGIWNNVYICLPHRWPWWVLITLSKCDAWSCAGSVLRLCFVSWPFPILRRRGCCVYHPSRDYAWRCGYCCSPQRSTISGQFTLTLRQAVTFYSYTWTCVVVLHYLKICRYLFHIGRSTLNIWWWFDDVVEEKDFIMALYRCSSRPNGVKFKMVTLLLRSAQCGLQSKWLVKLIWHLQRYIYLFLILISFLCPPCLGCAWEAVPTPLYQQTVAHYHWHYGGHGVRNWWWPQYSGNFT